MFKLLKNEFDYCKDINWKDVIDKIDYECRNRSTCKIMYNNFTAPTFILENDSYSIISPPERTSSRFIAPSFSICFTASTNSFLALSTSLFG